MKGTVVLLAPRSCACDAHLRFVVAGFAWHLTSEGSAAPSFVKKYPALHHFTRPLPQSVGLSFVLAQGIA